MASRRSRRVGIIQNVAQANNLLGADALCAELLLDEYPEIAEAAQLVGQANALYQTRPPPSVPETTAAVNLALSVASTLANLQAETLS